MRQNIVAGNWKMNTSLPEGIDLAQEIKNLSGHIQNDVTIILAPPFVHLTEVKKIIEDSKIHLAAQNCSAEKKGAFTGEVSAEMVKSSGAGYVIIGHSERRAYFNEDNLLLSRKIDHALNNSLLPIYCCGEKLDEREAGRHFDVVKYQIQEGLFDLAKEDFQKVVVAYEPVWAIGTGVNATPEQAQEMHKFIRKVIADRYGEKIAEETTILYGGSCKPSNARELFSNPDVDGGLIGGASLQANDFIDIINSL